MFSDRINDNPQMQRAICLLLCVAAWRGPVPMLHDHQSMSDPEVRERHEQAFHQQSSAEEFLGLHWHFAVPEDVNEQSLPISDEVVPELALFACAAASQSMESGSLEVTIHSLLLRSTAFREFAAAARLQTGPLKFRPRSFLASLLCDVPLTVITGVCLL